MNTYNICDITPFTLQDYPEHIACIVWFSGCNMLCSYCHNLDLVFENERSIAIVNVLEFLKTRIGKIEAVVFCGGEPTLYQEIITLANQIKDLGFKIKLDTNGAKPKVLKALLPYIDYVAIDFKATKDKFYLVTNSSHYDNFIASLDILISSNIEFEIRTTYHSVLLDYDDLNIMIDFLESKNFKGKFCLQNYQSQESYITELPKSQKLDSSRLNNGSFLITIR